MKIISIEQIKMIIDELIKLNIPTQSFLGIQKFLTELPDANKENNAKPEVQTK